MLFLPTWVSLEDLKNSTTATSDISAISPSLPKSLFSPLTRVFNNKKTLMEEMNSMKMKGEGLGTCAAEVQYQTLSLSGSVRLTLGLGKIIFYCVPRHRFGFTDSKSGIREPNQTRTGSIGSVRIGPDNHQKFRKTVLVWFGLVWVRG